MPPTGQKRTKQYIAEGLNYIKNMNKWQAANEYAKDRGWEFQVWTEKTLQEMKLMTKKPGKLKAYKPYKPYNKPKKRINRKTSTNKNCFSQINNVDRECIGRYPANLLHDGSTNIEQFSNYFYCAKADEKDRNKYNEACEYADYKIFDVMEPTKTK